VPDARALLDEIYRVLRPGGACFFAAGNRFVLIEEHYHLPLLAAIPKRLAHHYIRWAGKADYYYENHLSYWSLKKLVARFDVVDYSRRVVADPERFHATDMIAPGSLKQRVALAVYDHARWLFPTYLWVLRKPGPPKR
jgi:SAM-dependent methyltransferase